MQKSKEEISLQEMKKVIDRELISAEYRDTISQLCIKIDALKSELEEYRKCVEFYADKETWVRSYEHGTYTEINDDEELIGSEDYKVSFGGKLARQTLSKFPRGSK